ncbi:MAG: hypothetical protein KDC92_13095 [Bacteroidetes bacterium]|nr:hypothetical protein [Bacteroidota bacterium]
MNKIIFYLRDYLKAHFNWGLFLTLGIFLAVVIYWNFTYFDIEIKGKIYNRNFERSVLDEFRNTNWYFLVNFLYYMVPYLVGAIAVGIFGFGFSFLKKPGFWIVLSIFAAILAGDTWFKWYDVTDNPETRGYWRSVMYKLVRAGFYFVPITIYYLFRRKQMESFHGLTTKGFIAKPYLIMMAIMVPALIWASFDKSFLAKYPLMPTHHAISAAEFYGVSLTTTFSFYQLLYAITFVGLELCFRGFVIFEMERYLGEKVVIPMVCVYCTLHFGKPMMECVSSIFGGFILGVIALKSRSVFGGVWVHIFIAVGMDVLAYLQKFVFTV